MISRERDLIGLRANIGVGDPDQLVAGDALAGRRHARQAEIGGVGENGGKQRVLVVAAFARAQVRKSVGEAGSAVHFVQQFGDTDRRQHAVDCGGEGFGFGRGCRLHRCDMQLAVTELDPVEGPGQQAGEAL